MNSFELSLHNGPLVPVYDIVPWRAQTQLVAIGPYYNRPGWAGVEVLVNGRHADWWMEEDPNQFCNIVKIDMPAAGWSDPAEVYITQRGRTAWSGDIWLSPDWSAPGHIAIATLARDDWPWIAEWIEHHREIGIEHFYIYNNGSSSLTHVLAP